MGPVTVDQRSLDDGHVDTVVIGDHEVWEPVVGGRVAQEVAVFLLGFPLGTQAASLRNLPGETGRLRRDDEADGAIHHS